MTAAPAARPLRLDARAYALVALLALAASGPSLLNGFAYDDRWIIETNNRVHDLHRWAEWFRTAYWPTLEGSLYRPLTTTGFALQWALAHGAPWLFHAVNVALYAGGAVAFTWLASLLLPPVAALVVGVLFAVDPVHVEAVGNVVGQAELSAGLLMLLAMAVYIRERRTQSFSRQTTLLLAATYLVAVLLKEHAMALPACFVAAECTVLRHEGTMPRRVRALLPLYVLLCVIAAFALGVRYDILGSFGGDTPHPALLDLGAAQRALVMLGVLPDLARLLLWPAKLYADYSPAHVIISPAPNPTQLNGLLIVAGACVLFAVAWRRSMVAAFGLLLALAMWLPTANLVFPSGILLAERTLYLPSAGILLAVGTAIAWFDRKYERRTLLRGTAGAVLATVLVLGVVTSVERQRVWRSSEDVFLSMYRDEPLSFRAHYAWGGVLFDRGDLAGGEIEWRMAIRIFPGYYKLYQDLAGKYTEARLCKVALPLYQKALQIGGVQPLSRAGMVACQLQLAEFRAARATARAGVLDGNDPAWFRARLFSADSALAANDSSGR